MGEKLKPFYFCLGQQEPVKRITMRDGDRLHGDRMLVGYDHLRQFRFNRQSPDVVRA